MEVSFYRGTDRAIGECPPPAAPCPLHLAMTAGGHGCAPLSRQNRACQHDQSPLAQELHQEDRADEHVFASDVCRRDSQPTKYFFVSTFDGLTAGSKRQHVYYVFGTNRARPYFDIDPKKGSWSKLTAPLTEDVATRVFGCICDFLDSKYGPGSYAVEHACGPEKFSVHICLLPHSEPASLAELKADARAFTADFFCCSAADCADVSPGHLLLGHILLADDTVYKRNQQWRLRGMCKEGTNRYLTPVEPHGTIRFDTKFQPPSAADIIACVPCLDVNGEPFAPADATPEPAQKPAPRSQPAAVPATAVDEKARRPDTVVLKSLSELDPKAADAEESWKLVGLALHAMTGGSDSGFEMFDRFSALSKRYDRDGCVELWRTGGARCSGYGMHTLRSLPQKPMVQMNRTYNTLAKARDSFVYSVRFLTNVFFW